MVQGHKRPLHEGLPRRLRALRRKAQLTQSALSLLIDWSSSGIVSIEAGDQMPAIDTVERLAAALGVSPAWLAYGDDADRPFRQRQPRRALPPETPEPEPAARRPAGFYRGVGARLKQARELRGLTMRSVAKAAGISPQALLLAEAGRMVPRVSTCESLATALDVPPGWLAYSSGSLGQARSTQVR